MNLWQRLKLALRVNYSPEVLKWLGGGSAVTSSGITVTPEIAHQCGAVLACMRILSGTAAQLPLKVYRRTPDGKEPATDHPVQRALKWPNDEWTSFELRERIVNDSCLFGSAYCQLVLDGKGIVREIWPLVASRVTVKRESERGPRRYHYRDENGQERVFAEDEILITPLLSDGMRGRSLVDMARETIGLSITTQEFASRFFANDATPRLILKTAQSVGPEQKKSFLDTWFSRHGGANKAHGVGFISGTEDIKVIESDVQKLQLIESRKFQLEEVARVFGIPLHLIQSLDRSTNNNIEHQGIDFVTHTANPWLKRIEERMNMSLFGRREREVYFVEFDVNGLMRGDYKSRTEGYSKLIASSVMTPNEARNLENMNPMPGGDKLYIQGAMIPSEMAGQNLKQQTEVVQ